MAKRPKIQPKKPEGPPMQPKDLLTYLQKGDRTMDDLKDVQASGRSPEFDMAQIRTLNSTLAASLQQYAMRTNQFASSIGFMGAMHPGELGQMQGQTMQWRDNSDD